MYDKVFFNPIIDWSDDNYPVYLVDKIKDIATSSYSWYSNFFKYTAYDDNLKQFVTHTYAVNITKSKGTRVQEIVREYENMPTVWRNAFYSSYGCYKGFHAVWNKKKYNYYSYYDCECDDEWSEMPKWLDEKSVPNYYHELTTAEEIIANDLTLRYFSWSPSSKVNLMKYIRLYRQYPIGEMLMKLGLYRFCESEKALKTVTENKRFRKWIFANHEQCNGLAFTTCYNSFKKNPESSVVDYYNSLQYRIFCGKEVAKNNTEIYNQILQYTTQEKLYSYLKNNNINNTTYFDYIKACQFLRLDFNDTKVLYPNNFIEMHDNYINQYNDFKNREEAKKHKKVSDNMKLVAVKYGFLEYAGNEYSIINAQSKLDLIEESSSLGHCVGRFDYDQRQCKEESMICFLRKNTDIEKSFVTIELDLDSYKIKQCYGKNNSKVEEIEPFVAEWMLYIKNQLKEMRDRQ